MRESTKKIVAEVTLATRWGWKDSEIVRIIGFNTFGELRRLRQATTPEYR